MFSSTIMSQFLIIRSVFWATYFQFPVISNLFNARYFWGINEVAEHIFEQDVRIILMKSTAVKLFLAQLKVCIGKLCTDGVQPDVQSGKCSLKTDTHTDSKSKLVESLKMERVGECRKVWLPLKKNCPDNRANKVGWQELAVGSAHMFSYTCFAPFTWLHRGTGQLTASSYPTCTDTRACGEVLAADGNIWSTCMDTRACGGDWQPMVISDQPEQIPESALLLCFHEKKNCNYLRPSWVNIVESSWR